MRVARRAVLAGAVAVGALSLLSPAVPAAALSGPATPFGAALSGQYSPSDVAAPAAPLSAPGLRVELTSLEPAVVTAGANITLQGRVTNQLGTPLAGVELELQLHSATSMTRAGLYQFLSTGEVDGGVDQLVGVLPLAVALAPDESAEFSFSFPASQLPDWGLEEWGPRGLTVSAHALSRPPATAGDLEYRWPSDQREDGPEGWARTFLVWDSGQERPTIGVSVLAPLVANGSEIATALQHGAPISRVAPLRTAELARAGALPGITLAVDPMLLQPDLDTSQFLRTNLSPINALAASARRAPTPLKVAASPTPAATTSAVPTVTPASSAAPASSGATPLATGTALNEAVNTAHGEGASPSASATVGATQGATAAATSSPLTTQPSATPADRWAALPLAHALREDDEILWLTPWDVPAGREYPTTIDWLTEAVPGVPTLNQVAWIDADTWDGSSLHTALQGGQFASVIAPAQETFPPDDAPPVGSLEFASGETTFSATGVQPDRLLSLTAAGKDLQGNPLTGLERRQLLISQTAVLAKAASETAGAGSAFLAAIERGNPFTAADLTAVSAALEASPWVTPEPLSHVMAVAGGGATAVELAGADSAALSRLSAVKAGVDSLDPLLSRSTAPSAYWAVEGAAAQLSSSAWAYNTDSAAAEVFAQFHHRLDTVNRAVGINSPSTINLIDSSAQVPLTLHNPLPVPVRVGLLLTPHSAHLQFEEVTASLVASRDQVVHVPVKAVGNADVDVLVELYGHTGTVVGSPTMLLVRVRADWEKLGFGTVSAFGLLLFALALVRNYMKRRHTGPGEESTPGEPANSWIPPRPTTRPPQPHWAKLQDTDERQD